MHVSRASHVRSGRGRRGGGGWFGWYGTGARKDLLECGRVPVSRIWTTMKTTRTTTMLWLATRQSSLRASTCIAGYLVEVSSTWWVVGRLRPVPLRVFRFVSPPPDMFCPWASTSSAAVVKVIRGSDTDRSHVEIHQDRRAM
jgi:hypothetical protein